MQILIMTMQIPSNDMLNVDIKISKNVHLGWAEAMCVVIALCLQSTLVGFNLYVFNTKFLNKTAITA